MNRSLTYTCQGCAAQHDADGPAVKGSIQPGKLKFCKPCNSSTFHFVALGGGVFNPAQSSKSGVEKPRLPSRQRSLI